MSDNRIGALLRAAGCVSMLAMALAGASAATHAQTAGDSPQIRFVRGTPGQSVFWTIYTWNPSPFPGECIEERYINLRGQDARLDRRGRALNSYCNRDWEGQARPIEAAQRLNLVPYDGPALGVLGMENRASLWSGFSPYRPAWERNSGRTSQPEGSGLNFIDWGPGGPLLSPSDRITFRVQTGADGQPRCFSETRASGPSLGPRPPSIREVDLSLCDQYAQTSSTRPGRTPPLESWAVPGRRPPAPAWPNMLFTEAGNAGPNRLELPNGSARANMIFNDLLPPGDALDTEGLLPNVVYVSISGASGGGTCSGTVINRRQILTAAHCVDSGDVTGIRVGFGSPMDSPPFNVISVSYHEEWDGNFLLGRDVAVLTLDDPVQFVAPVALAGQGATDGLLGSDVFLGGYGSYGNPATGLVSGGDGLRRIGRNRLDFVGYIDEVPDLRDQAGPGVRYPLLGFDLDDPTGNGPNVLGGGAVDGEAIASLGDSGSGLFINTPDGPVQIGIVSFGYGLANPGNRFTYGALDFYTPLFAFRDWIDAASPFVQASRAGGDGNWSDGAHWEDGIVPENYSGPFRIAAGPVFTPLYEVFLDGPGTTRIADLDFFEIDALTLSHGEARLEIAQLGILVAESYTDITAGTIQLDGVLATSQVRVGEEGRLLIGAEGALIDTSLTFDGGIFQQGGLIDVAGTIITDGVVLTGGEFFQRESGYHFDLGGTLNMGGGLNIDGYWDTWLFTQLDGQTDIGATGTLYDFEGQTLVSGGNLNVDGVLDTLALIQDGGLVSGRGTILAPDIFIQYGGGIMPGGDVPGTLSVIGNYYMDSGAAGMFRLNRDPAQSGRLFVDGWAEIYGTIIPVFEQGLPSRGDRFVLVRATNGTGGDPMLERPAFSAMIDFQLSFTEDSLVLSLIARDFADWAASPQQRAVANALDTALAPFEGALPGGSFGELVGTLDYLPEGADVSRALESLNPTDSFLNDRFGFTLSRVQGNVLAGRVHALSRGEQAGYSISAAPAQAGQQRQGMMLASLAKQQDAGSPANEWDRLDEDTGIFLNGGFSTADYQLTRGEARADMVFLTAGIDRRIGDTGLVGLAGGYARFDAGAGRVQSEGEALSLLAYGGIATGRVQASAYAGYARLDFQSARPVFLGNPAAGGTVLNAQADSEATQFMAGLDAQLVFTGLAAQWGPAVRVRHAGTDFDAYSETGAGVFGASVAARSESETLAGIGAFAAHTFEGANHTARVEMRVLHQSLLDGSAALASATLNGGPVTFPVQGVLPDEHFYTVETGIDLDLANRWSLEGGLSADLGRTTGNETTLSLQARWRF